MKRPEGFDRPPVVNPPAEPKLRRRSTVAAPDVTPERPATRASADTPATPATPAGPARPRPAAPRARATPASSAGPAPETADDPAAAGSDRASRRAVRRAARQSRRFEKSEVRRFTRRSRRRRVAWAVTLCIIVTMATLVAVAVYSPLLALKTIQIDGTSRLNADNLHAAVDGQLDTPLALIDFDRITEELGDFPLVRSYVTETVPPNTLIIHIVEREPVGSLATGSGFDLVDPAGVVVERSQARIPGVPLIDIGGAGSDSAAFDAAVEVLVALPEPVLVQLDTIVAGTRDDVKLTLAGGGATIIWGSADDSAIKARILAAALAQNYPNVLEYNVSAPGQLTYR